MPIDKLTQNLQLLKSEFLQNRHNCHSQSSACFMLAFLNSLDYRLYFQLIISDRFLILSNLTDCLNHSAEFNRFLPTSVQKTKKKSSRFHLGLFVRHCRECFQFFYRIHNFRPGKVINVIFKVTANHGNFYRKPIFYCKKKIIIHKIYFLLLLFSLWLGRFLERSL